MKDRSALADYFMEKGFVKGAEVGVWKGGYSSVILTKTTVKNLMCVDPWDGSGMSVPFDGDAIMIEAKSTLATFGDRCSIFRNTSCEAASFVKNRSLCFVYIDANHSYESVKEDINLWLPKIKKGGIISGHDYNNRGSKRVKEAVDELFPQVNFTNEKCSSWWIEI